MMCNLFINPDGANPQAQAVLAYLRAHDVIGETWNNEQRKGHEASPTVARWHNFREQGYVISLSARDFSRQLNIAFFEHRNSDEICAVEWEQKTFNPPIIDTAEFGSVYENKFDVSYRVDFGEAAKMADWIYKTMEDWLRRSP